MSPRISFFSLALSATVGALGGCTRKNPSHCANNDGQCDAGLVCSRCQAQDDGCVEQEPDASCRVNGDDPATTNVADDDGDGSVTSTTASPPTTTIDPSTTTDDEGEGSSSGGPVCGNEMVEPGEDCEPGLPTGAFCKDGTTELGCHENCTFDPSRCGTCNDGDIDPGEQCDGRFLGSYSSDCREYADDNGAYLDGEVICQDCVLSFEECTPCVPNGQPCTTGQCCGAAICVGVPTPTCALG